MRIRGVTRLLVSVLLPAYVLTVSAFLLLCIFVVTGLKFLAGLVGGKWNIITASVCVPLISSEIQNVFSCIYWPFRFPVLKIVSLYPLPFFLISPAKKGEIRFTFIFLEEVPEIEPRTLYMPSLWSVT